MCHLIFCFIPKPVWTVWAVGFALEQTFRDATFTVFSYVDFKVASAYYCFIKSIPNFAFLFFGDSF
jgi:hypothetical protein